MDPSTRAPSQAFAAIKAAHDALAEERRAARRSGEMLPTERIEAFVAEAVSAGRRIERDDERRPVQSMIDYWTTELLLRMKEAPPDWRAPIIAPFEGQDEEAAALATGARDDRRWEIVRLQAAARQWRDSGEDRGYLLSGTALEEAREVVGTDPDLSRFVQAALREQDRQAKLRAEARFRQRRNAVIALAVALVAVSGALTVALVQRNLVTEERDALLVQNAEILEQFRSIRATQDELDHALVRATRADARADRAEAQLRAVDRERATWREISAELQTLIQIATRNLGGEPGNAWTVVVERLRGLSTKVEAIARSGSESRARPTTRLDRPSEPSAPAPTEFNRIVAGAEGYRPDFLGRTIPLPELTPEARERAFRGGEPVPYLNYAVALDQVRRTALYAVSHIDRTALVVVPRASSGRSSGAPFVDPRLPVDVQADLAAFAATALHRGHLIHRANLAWGAALGDGTFASERLILLTDVATNIAPQVASFNVGAWSALDSYVLENIFPVVTRLTVFTGPVLSNDDPVIDGIKTPRAYWRLVVAAEPFKSNQIIVRAFLLRQLDENGVPLPRATFDPIGDAISIAELERLTGLTFPAEIRNALGSTPEHTLTAAQREPAAPMDDVSQFDGVWSGRRGYTDPARASQDRSCLGGYQFTARISDGEIVFESDDRVWTGKVDKTGAIEISRSGIEPPTRNDLSVRAQIRDGRAEGSMYSGFCGSGFFELERRAS